jgi:hypothetical protein
MTSLSWNHPKVCSTTHIFIRILLTSVFLVVLEVFAIDIVVSFAFDFFFVVDFLRHRLGLALLGFRSCGHAR